MPPCVFAVAVAFISFVLNLSNLQWELKEQAQCLRGVLHALRTLQKQPRVASLSLLARTGSTKISPKSITRNISFIIKKKYKSLFSFVIWQFIFCGFIALNVGSSNPFSFSRLKKKSSEEVLRPLPFLWGSGLEYQAGAYAVLEWFWLWLGFIHHALIHSFTWSLTHLFIHSVRSSVHCTEWFAVR